jgi:uncharacterized protein (DUF1800 family)
VFYLDHWLSAAPGYQAPSSTPQFAKSRGLNENYARELMELQTLGIGGGYVTTQPGTAQQRTSIASTTALSGMRRP